MAGLESFTHTSHMVIRDPFIEGLRQIFDARPDLKPATVAVAAGLDNSTLRKLLAGSNASPRVDTAQKIATAMGYSLSDIIAIGEHPDARPAIELLEELQHLPASLIKEALTYAQFLAAQQAGEHRPSQQKHRSAGQSPQSTEEECDDSLPAPSPAQRQNAG